MSACPPGETSKDWYARMRAEGRCCRCGCTIGIPPQPTKCDACIAKKSAENRQQHVKRMGFDKPIINPTFADFEREERRRGRR